MQLNRFLLDGDAVHARPAARVAADVVLQRFVSFGGGR